MADRVRRCQNDHRAARSAHPSLRHRRDRQRELAVQESKLSTVTTGAKGDVVLGYDGSGLRPPPSYPRTTMRWWSPFTCRSRSPLPRRLTNRAFDVPCYEPGYTLVEKLQTISTQFRRHLEDGSMPKHFLRHYSAVSCIPAHPGLQEFLGHDATVGPKDQ